MSRILGSRGLAVLTIFLIAGTLISCGRYGSPVRPVPQAGLDLESPVSSDDPDSGESGVEEKEAGSDKKS